MRAVADRSDEVVRWAGAHIPMLRGGNFSAKARAIGVETAAGELVGAVVFHNYQPLFRTMEVSAAASDPRWMRCREAFALMWRYAYDSCDVDKLYSLTPSNNPRAIRFVLGLGFKPEAVLARQYGVDAQGKPIDALFSSHFREWRHG